MRHSQSGRDNRTRLLSLANLWFTVFGALVVNFAGLVDGSLVRGSTMLILNPKLLPKQFLRPLYLIRAEHERQLIIGKELIRLASLQDINFVSEIGGLLSHDHPLIRRIASIFSPASSRVVGFRPLNAIRFRYCNCLGVGGCAAIQRRML